MPRHEFEQRPPGAREVGAVLLEIRKERRRTREAVAAEAKVTVSTLQKLETAKVNEPSWQTVVALLDCLGESLDAFERRRRAPASEPLMHPK